ncbi:MAG TPA: DUF5074 domain-containing protein [Flavobacterium sp.]|jgi:YVTN family beta-propeller protein
MIFKRLFLALIAPFILFSCDSDDVDNAPLGSYDNGLFVLNEGGFGEVTYISDDLQTVQQDVFSTVNGDELNLGTYNQSMFFDGDRAYIISNGSHKITVVNRYTFEYIATISTGMMIPRYGVVYNGKAYVTNINDYAVATDDFITVIDLDDHSTQTIAVNNQAERLVEYNGKLYVSGGAFGMGDTISVIDTATNAIQTTITVAEAPNSLEVKDGILYVLCGSFSQNSKLVKIQLSNNTIIDEVEFPATMGNASNLDIEEDWIYFSVGAKVYKIATTATTVSNNPLFDTQSDSDYIGYGFAVNNGRIYISEAAEDFTSNGKIYIYSVVGTFIDDVPVGLGPNGFYFNN